MPATRLKINCKQITGWGTFHDLFTQLFGFPATYNRTMSAWIKAVEALDEPEKGLTTLKVPPGELLIIEMENVSEFAEKYPLQYAAIVECAAQVNLQRLEAGRQPNICLAYFKN